MKKLLLFFAAFVSLAALARAGNVTTYPNVSSVTSADLFFDWQSGTEQNATAAQLKTYLLGGGTLAIASGKTLTANNTLTFAGTDSSSVNFGAGGTVLYSLGTGTVTEAWSAALDKLAALSPPSASGEILSSTSGGTLSWIAPTVTATAGGTNTYTATPSPALSAYTAGLSVLVKFTNANTGGASLNLNGLGAVALQQSGAAITAGQVPAGATLNLVYDGTYFQIVGSPYTSYTFASPLVNTTGTVALTVGSSGGVEAWNAKLDTLASPASTTGYVWTMTGTNTSAFEALPTATTSAPGMVQPDGSTITISGSVISASGSSYTLPAATPGSLGGVIPDGVTITVDGFGDIAVGSVPSSDITGLPTFPFGTIVGTSDSQTLTNKSIASTEITGLPAFPSGTIVGTSDSQTLTNKSIAASEINSGTLTVGQGGTGSASFTAYGTVVAGSSSTAPLTSIGTGTLGQVLESNGSGAPPSYQNVPVSPGWTYVNGNITASAGQHLWLYGIVTVTLPSSPNNGDTVEVFDALGTTLSGVGWGVSHPSVVGPIQEAGNISTGTVTFTKPFGHAWFVANNYSSWSMTYVQENSHLPGTPTIAGGTGAGASPTVGVTGSDVSGLLTITTGTGTAASATVATVTFNAPYATAPNAVILAPGNAAAAALTGTSSVVGTVGTTTLVVTSGTGTLTPSTQYKWQYVVPQE